MGDRSCVTYIIPKSVFDERREWLLELIAPEMETEERDTVELFSPEEQGGGYEVHEQLVAARIPFFSYWDAGVEYSSGSECFIPDLGRQEVHTTYADNRTPLIRMLGNGQVCRRSIGRGRKFLRLLRRFNVLCRKRTALSSLPAQEMQPT